MADGQIQSLDELEPGMQLGEDIYAGDHLLLPEGRKLTAALIDRLQRYDEQGVIIRLGSSLLNKPVTERPEPAEAPEPPEPDFSRSFGDVYAERIRNDGHAYTEDERDLIRNMETTFEAGSLTSAVRPEVFLDLTEELDDLLGGEDLREDIPVERIAQVSEELIEEFDSAKGNVLPVYDPEDPGDYQAKHAILTTAAFLFVAGGVPLFAKNRSELVNISLLLNIGFNKLDSELLNKAGALNPKEKRLLAQAFYSGYHRLLEMGVFQRELLEKMFLIYERPDGNGLLFGLEGPMIPELPAQYSVCSAYDSLNSTRPYRKRMHQKEAVDTIVRGVGDQFKRDAVNKFVRKVGVFPNGTLVRVGEDRYGVVSKQNKARYARPVVTVVLDGDKRRYQDPIELDLSESDEEITKVVKLP